MASSVPDHERRVSAPRGKVGGWVKVCCTTKAPIVLCMMKVRRGPANRGLRVLLLISIEHILDGLAPPQPRCPNAAHDSSCLLHTVLGVLETMVGWPECGPSTCTSFPHSFPVVFPVTPITSLRPHTHH
ncbi:uncharacterized protein SCHCODRAFT_012232 [Schizophyllum commune H4-8]|uniref:Expressed protein n=1 Tax=Schizophyllum commune (strain H4-8 / FGSC 9210) TaxID=578458 RepID=D8QIP6_SCHCM|nr:uncharacterized protein SCHCODRAFT_012232 [Schizophyllum commune H4-8]KAI5886091.1 hypothetical protein SCHCODRAFT_012232 [Schizophyllum commune H4-8]